mgnify:CR=1 FL=1
MHFFAFLSLHPLIQVCEEAQEFITGIQQAFPKAILSGGGTKGSFYTLFSHFHLASFFQRLLTSPGGTSAPGVFSDAGYFTSPAATVWALHNPKTAFTTASVGVCRASVCVH